MMGDAVVEAEMELNREDPIEEKEIRFLSEVHTNQEPISMNNTTSSSFLIHSNFSDQSYSFLLNMKKHYFRSELVCVWEKPLVNSLIGILLEILSILCVVLVLKLILFVLPSDLKIFLLSRKIVNFKKEGHEMTILLVKGGMFLMAMCIIGLTISIFTKFDCGNYILPEVLVWMVWVLMAQWMHGEQGGADVQTEVVYAVQVSAVALLSFIYKYLIGYVDTKSFSTSSSEFRPTYISIVLFQGSYVWIKFRDVASVGGGYRRPVRDKLSGTTKRSDKYEARYKPPRESTNSNHIYLGMCSTSQEAEMKKRIAAFYYGRNEGRLDLGNGDYFLIPSPPRDQVLSLVDKRAWVKVKVKEVYEEFLRAKDARSQPGVGNNTNFHSVHENQHEIFTITDALEGPLVDFSSAYEGQPLLAAEVIAPALAQGHNLVFAPQEIQASAHQGNMVENKELNVEVESFSLGGTPSSSLNGGWGDGVSFRIDENIDLSIEDFLNDMQRNTDSAATSNEVEVGTRIDEDAPHSFQAGEIPMSLVLTPQEGSEATEALPDLVIPSVNNICPTFSTTELLVKVIGLQEQKIQEQGRKIQEQGRKIQEQATKIFELERENKRLRGNTWNHP